MFERLVKLLERIRNSWWPEESNSIGEFINRIMDPSGEYSVTIILRHQNRSVGDNIIGSTYASSTYHYCYYFIAQATSGSGDREVIFSRYIGDGSLLTTDPGTANYKLASFMEDQAIREVRDLRERINRRLPEMKVEIIQRNGIFSEDKVI